MALIDTQELPSMISQRPTVAARCIGLLKNQMVSSIHADNAG